MAGRPAGDLSANAGTRLDEFVCTGEKEVISEASFGKQRSRFRETLKPAFDSTNSMHKEKNKTKQQKTNPAGVPLTFFLFF